MKTMLVFASSIVMMIVMYVYFLAVCLYALVVLPIIKLNNLVVRLTKTNQFAGI